MPASPKGSMHFHLRPAQELLAVLGEDSGRDPDSLMLGRIVQETW